jgi:uncharacterized membrane protein
MNYYLLLKTIHLLAVVAFLGNIATGLFWMRFAVRTNDLKIIRHTASGIIASDRWFTIPGVIIITAGGFSTAIYAGIPLLRTGWIFWPIILFSLSGVFFVYKVAPLQSKMRRYLDTSILNNSYEEEKFTSLLKQWEFWGFMALLTPVLSFLMMILKWPVLSPLAR